jgi:hypothetical protein
LYVVARVAPQPDSPLTTALEWGLCAREDLQDVRIAPAVCEALFAGTHTVDKTKSANYN